MNEKRKAFQHLPENENPQFLEDGKRIYIQMKLKYPNKTNEDLDNILNGICVAMIFFMQENVDKSNHKYFLQVIWKILNANI